MEDLFSPQNTLVWAVVLGLALFLPVRRLIWTLYVRRAQRKADIDAAEVERLKRRAGVTAALICLVFAYLYTAQLFSGR